VGNDENTENGAIVIQGVIWSRYWYSCEI